METVAPEKIDDSAVEQKLAMLPTLKMSAQEMFDGFKDDQMQIRQRILANGGYIGLRRRREPGTMLCGWE